MVQSIEKMNQLLTGILQLVYLNFLFMITSLLGLIIFGVGPSTYAVVSVFRKKIRCPDYFPITKQYFYFFKENFKESVLISWIYGFLGIILVVDVLYVSNWYLRILIYLIGFIYMISLIYIFPLIANYNWNGIFFKMKMAFLFGFSQLQYTLVLIVLLGALYFLIIKFVPGILTFMGVSMILFVITWVSCQVFNRLEEENSVGNIYTTIFQIIKEKRNEKQSRKVSRG